MPVKELSDKLHPLEIRVRKTIQNHNMHTPGDHALVAVSGGADSVALLLCLHKLARELHISLSIAHLNHRIRGLEGDADEDFVRRLSADLKLPFFSEIIEVKQKAAAAKENLEGLARQTRYDFLRRTAQRIGAQKIAVGHTLNDQAETILFRFMRGSGIEGLSAIHPVVEGLVIRPLLECSRHFILEYLKQKGASYREDSTNKDLQHSRNRIRRELLPYLEEHFNPQLIPTLAREASLAREAWAFIESAANQAFENLHCRSSEGILINPKGLLELHPALQKQVLRRALRESLGSLRGVTFRHIESILSLCGNDCSGDQIRLPHGRTTLRQFDTLLLMTHQPQQMPSFIYRLDLPGECRVAEAGVVFRSTVCSVPDPKTMKNNRSRQAFLDSSALPRFLTIRSREPGDRYGGPGHRKVKKLLIDGKIPSLQRFGLPMVVAGNDVIWIPGFRPARAYEAPPGSPGGILLEVTPDPENGIKNSES
jgi:tRNA(Ile)-lysidine synthase